MALRAGLGLVANNVPALLRMTYEQLEASCRAGHGRTLAEMAESSAALVAVILRLADEARRLVDRLR